MIQISEERLKELIDSELALKYYLNKYPELAKGEKLTATAKRYKKALESLVTQVEEVCNHPSFKSVFEVSYIHGINYDGPTFGDALAVAKATLKRQK
jgi:hypothetical protein